MSETSKGLRELADFLDAHPAVTLQLVEHQIYVRTRDEIAALATIGGWRKTYNSDYFHLERAFAGDVTLSVFTDRAEVCRKVVTGHRTIPARPEQQVEIVEWVCEEPLLAERRA